MGIYALGLMAVNNLIGIGFALLGNIFSVVPILGLFTDYLSPIASITLGIILYIRLVGYGKGDEHFAPPVTLKVKKNLLGVFFLGILTAIPPCPFEIAIYLQALSASGNGKFLLNGILHVFWFSIGTIVGLFILTLFIRSVKKLEILKKRSRDLIQKIALIILIVFGIISLIFVIFDIHLFPAPTQLPGV